MLKLSTPTAACKSNSQFLPSNEGHPAAVQQWSNEVRLCTISPNGAPGHFDAVVNGELLVRSRPISGDAIGPIAPIVRDWGWWEAQAARLGTDWTSIVEAAFTMLVAAGILEAPEAERHWDAPSWREAAIEYHRDRPRGPAIEPERLARLRRLMADDVSLDRAWHELRDNRPTPEVTVEAIRQSVRERGLKALDEPVNQERLGRCDAAARARLDRWITEFQKGNC